MSPNGRGGDRITADVRLSEYSQTSLGFFINMLAPATSARVAPIEGDVASIELVFNAVGQPVHLFGGLRDFRTPLVVGSVLSVALAAAADVVLLRVQRRLSPWKAGG